MIDTFAEKIAIKFKQIDPEKTTSVDIMKYGIIMAFNGFSVVILAVLIGWLSGKFTETVFVLVSTGIFRFFAGGHHFASAWKCILFSTLIMITLPHIPVNHSWMIGLSIASLSLTLIYAPSNIEDQTRISKKYHPILKYISTLIVSSNFYFLSELLAITLFTQSLLLVKVRR